MCQYAFIAVVPNVPEGEHTPGQGLGACWVPLQLGLRRGMLARDIHAAIVVNLKYVSWFCGQCQHILPLLCPMAHVFLESAAHD